MKTLGIPAEEPSDELDQQLESLFLPRRDYPRPRTLFDNLPEGLSDAGKPAEPLKMPEPVQLIKPRQPDETIPAFAKAWRVGLNDFPVLGWVFERLYGAYPGLGPRQVQTILRTFMLDSECFFQMTERAILCAQYVREVMAQPYVLMLFLLHQDRGPEGGSIKGSPGEKDSLQLLRALRDWGRLKGAAEIRRLNDCSDLPPSTLVRELRAERREEVFLGLKD